MECGPQHAFGRSYSSASLASARDVTSSTSAKTTCLASSSHRRTSKKFKYDKGHLVKAELQKLDPKSDISSLPKVAPVAPCENKFAEGSAEAAVSVPESREPPQGCSKPASEEPSVKAENGLSTEPSSAAAAQEPDDSSARQAEPVPRTEEVRASMLQMDSSIFLDDDSNQPMSESLLRECRAYAGSATNLFILSFHEQKRIQKNALQSQR